MRFLNAIVVATLALAGCGGSDTDEAVAPQPTTVTETRTETQPATTEPESEPEDGCSAADLQLTLSDQELPPAVADVRKRVFDAAVACDYDQLEQIALEQGEGFTFSYGSGTDASDYWRSLEEAGTERPLPMRALATIVTLPVTRNESGSYAWPTAYNESPSEEDWRALVYAGLYGAAEIDLMQKQGTGYLGYRTAITADGDWQFFVAGD